MTERVIKDIVLENFANAKILYQEGIPFYNVASSTLKEACVEYQINHTSLEKKLVKQSEIDYPCQSTPIKDILHFLTTSHRIFIKQSLPYYASLIENLSVSQFENKHIVKDLQFIFPVFVEDFIHHVIEEEKTLFHYIETLIGVKDSQTPLSKAYMLMQKKNIASFALDHLHDDPLEGIRKLTNTYAFSKNASMHEKVIMYELKQFDKDLELHAQIEDRLLFSKALVLEQNLKQSIEITTSLN